MKKSEIKLTKSKQEELHLGWTDRNKFLKEIGLPKETFEQYLKWVFGLGKKDKSKLSNTNFRNETHKPVIEKVSEVKSLNEWITGPVNIKQTPKYTGTEMLGIGTLHKSNAIPIFNTNEAKDISSMRR